MKKLSWPKCIMQQLGLCGALLVLSSWDYVRAYEKKCTVHDAHIMVERSPLFEEVDPEIGDGTYTYQYAYENQTCFDKKQNKLDSCVDFKMCGIHLTDEDKAIVHQSLSAYKPLDSVMDVLSETALDPVTAKVCRDIDTRKHLSGATECAAVKDVFMAIESSR